MIPDHNLYRKQRNESTLLYADNHKQRWCSYEDVVVEQLSCTGWIGTLNVGYMIGRTYQAVEGRRQKLRLHVTLNPTNRHPKALTLQEALDEYTKQRAAGGSPQIKQVPGGWEVVEAVYVNR
ncbi:MAG: hypothetical protein KAJ19_10065 [Gammaproteobacteria bacterium]|nr:hypothetical protein [Gammaproteobacteria bacterium]